jgi:ribosomal protein L19E
LPAPPNSYIPLTDAARKVGYTRRHVRRLIEDGDVLAIPAEDYEADGRVRWLVSVTSLAAHRKRTRGKGRR